MERSFKKEVEQLELGDGDVFRGEGILAVTKALLQSGVSYVGGYQGAPVSHLLDVMVEAEDLLERLGVHVETCTNEAAAAAMLGASINYPVRGAVTWKSIVGTNVAADALSNLASPGVIGGALIILGEDYGEGASVIQERSYAYAMKSSMWLLDPRPDLPTIVRMVEKGFELSEASHAPVMLELRIRACHVTGEFAAKSNRSGVVSGRNRAAGPPRFEYDRLAHPPVIFSQERVKVEQRLPAARAFIREHKLNEVIAGDLADVGIVVAGGLTNSVLRALSRLDLADLYGASRVPILCAQRGLSAHSGGGARVLRRQARGPDRGGRLARLHRATDQCRAAPRRHSNPRHRQRTAAGDRRIHLRRTAQRAGRILQRSPSRRHRCRRHCCAGEGHAGAPSGRCRRRRRAAAAPADLLHRLPGTASVLRHQADATRAWRYAHQCRHRLPCIRDVCAVLDGQLHPRLRHVARVAPPRSRPISRSGQSP